MNGTEADKAKILVVDDELIVRDSLSKWFREDGFTVETAEDGAHALHLMDKGPWDVVLLDIKMPGISGLELQKKLKEIDKNAIVIMITAFASVESAVQALKEGAFDYVTKPVDPEHLMHLVTNALKQKNLHAENQRLKEHISEMVLGDEIVGASAEIGHVVEMAKTVARTDTTVMIRGESGTGKELIARTIHANSDRRYFPIIAVNCGAVSESLLESELFGHERGAFTGAQYRRKGKFEMADGGTIFLDEIGTISQKMQVELLRVLETKQFTRVGGNDSVKSDFRVIAATNRDIEADVQSGQFREDLYYRLNVFSIVIPPLRDRRTDIPALVEHFIRKYARAMNKNVTGIANDAMELMMKYNWPGNVRELENVIERAMVLAQPPAICAQNIPFSFGANSVADAGDDSMQAMEKVHTEKILQRTGWNITRAAEILNIDRVTLYNKISKYGLKKP